MGEDPGAGGEAARRAIEASQRSLQAVIERRLQQAQQLRQAAPATEPVEKLDDRSKRVKVEREESDLGLSKIVGRGTMLLMGFQVLVIDGGFFWYAIENEWHFPSQVIIAWLGAGTIQVVGSVALVVARHLFPGTKGDDESKT